MYQGNYPREYETWTQTANTSFRNEGVVLYELTTVRASLEEAYLELTGSEVEYITKPGFQTLLKKRKQIKNEKKIDEINTGVYIFKNQSLLYAIKKIDNNNSKGEY